MLELKQFVVEAPNYLETEGNMSNSVCKQCVRMLNKERKNTQTE